MQKGQIRVQTENIFPIIKKFLYSEHDIFLRELISNATDATQKLKTLSSIGEAKGELGDLRIDVVLNAKEKTICFEDRGVGMTKEEVDKYLNQVAFSGAEEFLQKYKDASIIGHFGLGFYSAFMVAEKVEVITQSHNADAATVYWSCDGSPEFELYEVEKKQRGTKIILHINDESKEFLEAHKLKEILNKFCKYLPIPIYFTDIAEEKKEGEEEKSINNTNPIWVKKPSDLTKEDYENFYRELYPFGETPLFWIHLNVDYPFNLTGILYFPKIKQSYEIQKDKIQLYSNQVFVTDEVKDIVPEFLMLLHGVIDSPDIPLNVSRSYLQGDPNVKKINNHITKKVADKLEEIFNKERTEFEQKWESLGLFVKYGMMTDDKFLEKANKFLLLENTTENKFYTLEEYKTTTEALQKNKEGKQVILYTTNPIQQDAYIQAAQAKGYNVVKMETIVDAAFINNMEMKWENVTFTRVDADITDNLIDKQDTTESVLSKNEEEELKKLFEIKENEITVSVEIKGLQKDSQPVIATRPEFMRRMKDMASMGGGMSAFYAQMPDEVTLTVNGNHPIYQTLLKESDIEKKEKQVRNLADLALLSQGLLKGAALTNFINRSVYLMQNEETKIAATV
ncbi:MAG TPA: molecular chaperone HtpG [Chitinophagaceae bacterium]|nr:molecular chaperone HtpG [Chitinophagaceae bacterium]HNE92606.1 molecular chaperone HtpG [Chitinophagaceae bacterium]HNF29484.1 molecular chaperone HtpG [Chitinophagaceae bacterium]HNJ57477.1 molecular chaperone HtpG [Chitinophagaceae bacterium]HNM35065.1 molecular chaperone HtpG [Chitinophagaceae bacterium]